MALDASSVLSSNEVLRGMEPGSNPLEWIEKNLAKSPIAQAQKEVTVTPVPAPKEPEAPKAAEAAPVEPVKEVKDGDEYIPDTEKPYEKPKGEGEADHTDAQVSAPEAEDNLEASKELNFKALRQKTLEAEKARKEAETAKAALEAKLKAYDEGTEIPEVVKSKDARIQELEMYEKLHALKRSPAYKEQFIKPIEELKGKLHELAADYEMPKEVMDEALNITNKAHLNKFLSENFDAVGALKVSELVEKAQAIQQEAKAAEEAPAKALERLEEEHKRVMAERRAQANNKIIATTKETWQESMLKIMESGVAEELIPRANDPEHNEKFVKPLVREAASRYGKIIKGLADNGLEHMPKELAFELAQLCQLAQATSVAMHSRNIAVKQAEEIQNNVKRTTSYERPPLGGFVGGGRGGGDKATGPDVSKMTLEEAGAFLANSALGRR